jgi:argininosuccinate lyase
MKLWGGRFSSQPDSAAIKLNASIDFDRRLGPQDVRGSTVWADALHAAGILTESERDAILTGLKQVGKELESGTFEFAESDEDIHTAVERRLGELVGSAAGKLHTGRSRNDQVATDFRLWLLDGIPVLERGLLQLQQSLVIRAEADMDLVLPGYTHTQRAQPVLLSHWWLSHFWPLQRDRQRLQELKRRSAVLPLGSGALAGVPFLVDRHQLAADLGFEQPSPNSIDAVSDRDFAAEFLFWAALLGVHLSRLADAVILFSSSEFGFIELSDAYATGSSLMPQKKNPDVFELARGKAGTLIGALAGMLAVLKGLPSAYDKDLQEDKLPVFAAYDTLTPLLPVLAGALETLSVNSKRMEGAIDASLMATDLADYLVDKGVPFREAHNLAGQTVREAAEGGVSIAELPLSVFQSLHPAFGGDVLEVFDPRRSVGRRSVYGGTAPEAVREQLQEAKEVLE